MPNTAVKTLKPTKVVIGIIQHPVTQHLLISQRSKEQHLAGLWEFPGGKIEQGEDDFHALQRELKEEVGVRVEAAYPLKQITHHYPELLLELHFWRVAKYDGKASSQEGQIIKWVEVNQLEDYDFPEANASILKSLHLSPLWMISDSCEPSEFDSFIDDALHSIKQYAIKQFLLRCKSLSDADYSTLYQRLKKQCEPLNCTIIVNRQTINEHISNAWHLTSKQLYQYNKRPIKSGFLSASCHNLKDIKQAEILGIDCILLSAVNKTSSHPDAKPMGWQAFKALANKTQLPVYALGGVKREDLTMAQYNGAIGIAGISTFKV